MTAHYCPASGTLLCIDIHEKQSGPTDDIVLDLDALGTRDADKNRAASRIARHHRQSQSGSETP